MKYKRLDVIIPHKVYRNWVRDFDKGEKEFDGYRCFIDINGLNLGLKFSPSIAYTYPMLLLRVFKVDSIDAFSSSDEKLYSTGFKKVNDLISIGTFIYKDITYILNFKIEDLPISKYMTFLKRFGTNPTSLELYIYSVDVSDSRQILDICSCFLQIKLHKEYISPKKTEDIFKAKLNVLEFFLNKLSYYGFEVNEHKTLDMIHRMTATSKEEIIQKEIEYLVYKLKYKDSLTDDSRIDIKNKSLDLYNCFMLL